MRYFFSLGAVVLGIGYAPLLQAASVDLTAKRDLVVKLRPASSDLSYVRHSGSVVDVGAVLGIDADGAASFLNSHFFLRKPLQGTSAPCVSFESLNARGSFLRKRGTTLALEKNDGTSTSAGEATFCAVTGLSSASGLSISPVSDAKSYLCEENGSVAVRAVSSNAKCTFFLTAAPEQASAAPSLPTTIDYGDIVPFGDPSAIQVGDKYYAFASNYGMHIRESTDLITWRKPVSPSPIAIYGDGTNAQAFPDWLSRIVNTTDTAMGAPDISFYKNKYHLAFTHTDIGSSTSLIPILHSAKLGSQALWLPSFGEDGAYSFQSVNFPSNFIRHFNGRSFLTELFTSADNEDAKFFVRPAGAAPPSSCASINDNSLVRFEWRKVPGAYLRHRNGRVILSTAVTDGSATFCEDSLFRVYAGSKTSSYAFETYQWRNVFLRHRRGELWVDYVDSRSPTYNDDRSFYVVTDMSLIHHSWHGVNPDNAMDPNIFYDDDGKVYMVYGSYATGIYMMELDADSLLRKSSAPPIFLAAPTFLYSGTTTGPIEAPFLIKRGGYYYLMSSYGNGYAMPLDYHLGMGRSKIVTGPYVNMVGKRLDQGFYTPLLKSYAFKSAINLLRADTTHENLGHHGILRRTQGDDFLVYHFGGFFAPQGKAARAVALDLHVRRLLWPDDNEWPIASVMRYAKEPEKSLFTPAKIAGKWSVKVNFQKDAVSMTLKSDGTIEGYDAVWFLQTRKDGVGTKLYLVWKSTTAPNGYWIDSTLLTHIVDSESTSLRSTVGFSGHNQGGSDVRGIRISN